MQLTRELQHRLRRYLPRRPGQREPGPQINAKIRIPPALPAVYDRDHLTPRRTCVILGAAYRFTTRRHPAQIVSVQNDRGSRYETGAVPQLYG